MSKNNIKYKLNGSEKLRWPGNINIQIKNIIASDLIKCVNDVYFSLGSACSDNSIEPSYVLKALCLKKKEAESSLRISIGRMTTKKEILESSQRISSAVYSLYKKRENS